MSRLPALTDPSREQAEYRELFRSGSRATGRGSAFSLVGPGGSLEGPPGIWVHALSIGRALEQLGGAVRFGLELPERLQELAILTVGATRESEFELFAHRRAARVRGVAEAEIAAVVAGRLPETLTAAERVAVEATTAILTTGALDDAQYAALVSALGVSGAVELVALVTYYDMLATQLRVFGVTVPPAWHEDEG
jgi:alkylhydroperoxidase family enzyme